MRDIKFRAWDVSEKEWIDIRHLGFEGRHLWYVQACDEMERDIDPPYFPEQGEIELMQFTGLHDKNGQEIYEGDIVKGKAYEFANTPRIIGEVIYDYCEFKVNSVREKTNRMKVELNTVYEVIGNVYEHPHLLEQE